MLARSSRNVNTCVPHLDPASNGGMIGAMIGVMDRAVVAGIVVAVAALVAVVVERRRKPDPPTQGASGPSDWPVPSQLDRLDFGRPDAPWLVVVFTSATCDSCRQTMAKAAALASDSVAVQEVEAKTDPTLHRRYGIEGVPTTVVADSDGVVRASMVGPPSAGDLWAAVAEVRGQTGGQGTGGDG